MTNSRFVLILAVTLVLVGLGLGGAAHVASRVATQESAEPSGPDALFHFVPEDASLVGFVDVRAVAASPITGMLAERMGSSGARNPVRGLGEQLGIDPFSDLRSATFSSLEPSGEERPAPWGVAFDFAGSFDDSRLRERLSILDGEPEEHAGTTLYSVERGPGAVAVALPEGESETLLVGQPDFVRAMLDAADTRGASAHAPSSLSEWSEELLENDTSFWLAGKPPGALPQLGAGTPGGALPPLASFALSGRLGEAVSLMARGRASTPELARTLADMVRGFVALGRLDTAMEPSLREVVDTVRVDQSGDRVEISLQVSYDALDALMERRAPPAASPDRD